MFFIDWLLAPVVAFFVAVTSLNFFQYAFKMTKSQVKLKRSISAILNSGHDEHDLGTCANRNCPSHWHSRLTEKLKTHRQSKVDSSSSKSPTVESGGSLKLLHSDVLSRIFELDDNDDNEGEIYSTPLSKSMVINKHELFIKQFARTNDNSSQVFVKVNLNFQMKYRLIPLVYDRFSNQMDRAEASKQLKINLLRINHVHLKCRLNLKVISAPVWNHSAVHVIVQDEHADGIRLSIYNWSYVSNTRQVKSYDFIQERLKMLLPLNSSIILLDPWLKKCQDGTVSLRCESPNTHLLLSDFHIKNTTSNKINVEQLRRLGNICYQANDDLGAIEFYTFALQQLDEQYEKELAIKGRSSGSKNTELSQHRLLLLSNRCACYLRERHVLLALCDAGILLSVNNLPNVFQLPITVISKLMVRNITAHAHLGLYDKTDCLIRYYERSVSIWRIDSSAYKASTDRELSRLRSESIEGRYDIQAMFNEQISDESQMMIADIIHHHASYRSDGLFEIRPCRSDELTKNGYIEGSYGAYASKDLEPGTLLIVEQPFASIDSRVNREKYCHTVSYWQKHRKTEYYEDDTLALLNEIEKQLLVGCATWTTFDRIKLMQPIRQWLIKHNIKINANQQSSLSDLLETYESTVADKKQWKKPFSNQTPPPLPCIPWRVLFETQTQNPFKSQLTQGWYPLGSMFNHSCLPNCIWYLLGDYLFIFVCGSNVRRGDELTISYCPLWISSVKERTLLLRRYNIKSCQCSLCSYDRMFIDEYESNLKKFSYFRALFQQKNISNIDRMNVATKLKSQYEALTEKFKERPIGFINEFIDLECILKHFQNINEVEEFSAYSKTKFHERLSNFCHFTLSEVSNPILLLGRHIELLIDDIEQSCTADLEQWNYLLNYIYRIYTFKSYPAMEDTKKLLQDQKRLFSNLLQTQSFVRHRQFIHDNVSD